MMDLPSPENSVRSEIYVDKRKLILYNIGIFLASFLIVPVLLYAKFDGNVIALAYMSLIAYMAFSCRSWVFFKKSLHLKIYDNGLEIKGLGFWLWEDVSCDFHFRPRSGLGFLLNSKGRDFEKKPKNIASSFYFFDKETDDLKIKFQFPSDYITNMSWIVFYKELERRLSERKTAPENAKQKKILWTWRTLVFGAEKITLRRFFWVSLSLIALSVALLGMILKSFFPLPPYKIYFELSLIILTLVTTLAFFCGVSRGKIKLNKNGDKKISGLVFVLLPVLFYTGFLFFFLGAGHLYTDFYGVSSKIEILVSDKKIRTSKGGSKRYCVESDDVGTGIFKEICVQKSDYDLITEGSVMTLYGKRSELGFVYEKYSLKANQ